jgi:hypothetical protein
MAWNSLIAAAFVAIGIFSTGTARADYEGKLIGNWLTSAKEDRFGDGGTFTAMTIDDGLIFGLRCIQKDLTFGVAQKDLVVGERFIFKFRVDRNDVFMEIGRAISDGLIQVTTTPDLIRQMRTGKELAVRIESESNTSTHVLKLRGSNRAFEDIVKACPLEEAEKPSAKENADATAPAETKPESRPAGKEGGGAKQDVWSTAPVSAPSTKDH